MRKIIAALLIVSGCTSASPAGPQTRADFIPNSNVIQVVINDPRPVRSVQLISPNGEVIPANGINSQRTVYPGYSPSPSVGLGIGGFSGGRSSAFGSGIGFGFPLGGGEPAAVQSVTTAAIPVPDLAAYSQNWQGYRIEALIGDPPTVLTLGAPPPPA
jgi:hypothetical protein